MAAHPSGSGSSRTGPMSTVASSVCGSSVGSSSTRRAPASVRMRLRREVTAPGRQRLGEAADAVAAHLGPAAVGVVQHHAGGVAGLALADEQPVGPDAGRAVAQPAGERRRGRRRAGWNATRKSLPSPWCLVRVVMRDPGPGSLVSASTTAGTASATGSRSTSIQRTRGSRRNHRSWRTANWRVRTTIESTAASRVEPALEVLDQLLVAERLGRRPRQPAGGDPRRPRRAARPPSSRSTRAADPLGERRAGPAQADHRRPPSAGRPAAPARTS